MDFFFTYFWSHWFLLHPSIIHDEYWLFKQNTGCSVLYTSQIFQFIISILKSPSNPVNWLVQIVWFKHESHYFQSESHLFVSKTKFHTTFRRPIMLQDFTQFANQIRGNNAHKMKYFPNFISCLTLVLLFKVNKVELHLHKSRKCSVSYNFGLISNFWFPITLLLRHRVILFTCVWYQIKLHSTHFNDHQLFFCLGKV